MFRRNTFTASCKKRNINHRSFTHRGQNKAPRPMFFIALIEVMLFTSWPVLHGTWKHESIMICLISTLVGIPTATYYFLKERCLKQAVAPVAWDYSVCVRKGLIASIMLSKTLFILLNLLFLACRAVYKKLFRSEYVSMQDAKETWNAIYFLSLMIMMIPAGLAPLILLLLLFYCVPLEPLQTKMSFWSMLTFFAYCNIFE